MHFKYETLIYFKEQIAKIFVYRNSTVTVAAYLWSLRSDDPLSKGHPRSIKQGLEL